jgi:hypothetical protein
MNNQNQLFFDKYQLKTNRSYEYATHNFKFPYSIQIAD